MRRLIVNADDFGLSAGVNRGIARAHERGIVTSASLMVRGPCAATAALYGAEHSALGLGLHVDVDRWRYAGDCWRLVVEAPGTDDPSAARAQVAAQLRRFEALVGHTPTHLDSHHHRHREEPLRSVVLELGARLGVPVRELAGGVLHCADFYARDADGAPSAEPISPGALCALLGRLPEGISELACHPAIGDDSGSSYSRERDLETLTLCDPRVWRALTEAEIALVDFRGERRARR